MATTTAVKAKTAAPRSRSRSHSKTIASNAGGVERSQQERRLLNWVYGNSEMIQRGIAREATHCGDNRQNIEMNRCLSLAAEFGRLAGIGEAGIPANFPRQQRSETQSEQALLDAAASA